MKRRATSSENRKLIATVVACAFTIVKQMLPIADSWKCGVALLVLHARERL